MRPIAIILYSVAILVWSGCQTDPEDYMREHKKDIFFVVVDTTAIVADGKSYYALTAHLAKDADIREVRFSSTAGKFQLSDTSFYSTSAALSNDSTLTAKAYLVSSTETDDRVHVTVTVATLDTTLALTFTTAYADRIVNESTVASIPRGYGSEVPVRTILLRNVGVASQHQHVYYEAFTEQYKPIGEFRGLSLRGSNPDGVAEATFVLKDTLYVGAVNIMSKYRGKDDVLLTDSLKIFVTNK